jgi:hypothetical protein
MLVAVEVQPTLTVDRVVLVVAVVPVDHKVVQQIRVVVEQVILVVEVQVL